jgi:hypothetical protein
MIGKPEWFKYRIFGWGVAPKTWQGWVYVCVFASLIGFLTAITMNNTIKMWLYAILVGILLLDIVHIMANMDKYQDERENYHQLIIERNCSFAAITALLCVALYQTYQNKAVLNTMKIPFDYSIFIVLIAMLVVKIGSTLYVRTKK